MAAPMGTGNAYEKIAQPSVREASISSSFSFLSFITPTPYTFFPPQPSFSPLTKTTRLKKLATCVQGSTKLFPVDHMIDWIFVRVQKDSNTKKESYVCTEP